MSGEARRAKMNYNMASAIGIDDMASMLDYRKKVDDFNKEVAKAQRKAKRKSGILGFIGLAVTAAFAFLNPFGFAATAAGLAKTGATAAAMGAGARWVGDELFLGDIKVPIAPTLAKSKYNKTKRLEQQGNIDDAYTDLASDISDIEQDIDMGHIIQPFTTALSWFGPQIIAAKYPIAADKVADAVTGVTEGSAASFDMNQMMNYASLTNTSIQAAGELYSAFSNTGGSDMGGGASGGTTDMSGDIVAASSGGATTGQGDVIDWDNIYNILGYTSPAEQAGVSGPSGQIYAKTLDDLDYLDELSDGEV